MLYRRGKVSANCTLVLTGKLAVLAGKDAFHAEAGPWTVLGAEAASFGDVLRRCERALERATQCSRVYTAALGSAKSGSHFHAHLVPLYIDGAADSAGTAVDGGVMFFTAAGVSFLLLCVQKWREGVFKLMIWPQ